MEKKILTIIGPTAVGKTAIAIEIAKQINGEVICETSGGSYSTAVSQVYSFWVMRA